MSAKSKSKSVLRSVKNFTKGYSDIEIKVRDATSNDPSLPSTTLMGQISAATNTHYMFMEVMNILDKRLNDKGKNWRHVYKALIVLDYLIHDGSDQVLAYIRDNMFIIKTLQQFQYVDEEGKDYGIAVRTKAKDLVSLLEHPDTLTEERTDRDYWMTRFTTDDTHSRALGNYRNSPTRKSASIEDLRLSGSRQQTNSRGRALSNSSIPSYSEREDADLKRALEESKRLAELEKERRDKSEEELKLALELSYYEAENRKFKGSVSSNDNTITRQQNDTVGDLLDLFEGPPVSSVPQGYIMNNTITATPQQPFGSQMGARQLLGDGGLESVKLNPAFAQGSFGYIPDHNAQQGNMYPKPSTLREQQMIGAPKYPVSSNTFDPFSDLVPSNALVPSNPSALSASGNPFIKSESMTPPSRLSDFDPYSTLGMQTMPQKIAGMPVDIHGQNISTLPSSLPNSFNNSLLSNSAMINPMTANSTTLPPVILHPTSAISGQYPMNPPFPPGNGANYPGQPNNAGFPQQRQFY